MKQTLSPGFDTILLRSEKHALECTIDNGITSSIYNHQIQRGYLTLSVSTKMVKKAIKLYELFFKRLFKEGFSLTLDCRSFYHCPASAIIVDGETIPVRVKEKRELKRMSAGYNAYIPTGVLAIDIYGGTNWVATKTLVETEKCKWSEVFENIIPYLRTAAARIKEDRLKTEAWQQKMREEDMKRKEHKKMIEDRANVVQQIMKDVQLYVKAETIRKYCKFATQTMACTDEYKEKMAIAMKIADWIDPTTDYTDEILAELYEVEDFL